MVAGFMEHDEDDKRTFGIVPDELSLRERLTRYYSIHARDRLEKVDNEVQCFEDDPQSLFDHVSSSLMLSVAATDNYQWLCLRSTQLDSLYGKDPLSRDSFVDHCPASPFEDASEQQMYMGFIEEALQHQLQHPSGTTCESNSWISKPGDGDEQLVLGGYIRGDEAPISEAVAAAEAADDPPQRIIPLEKADIAVEVLEVDLGLSQTCWSWSELIISPIYELTLLHWETGLLKQLGGTIYHLARSISSTAAQKAVEATVMNLVALTAALPLYLLSVVNTIDSMWIIASERAAAAGKELATVRIPIDILYLSASIDLYLAASGAVESPPGDAACHSHRLLDGC